MDVLHVIHQFPPETNGGSESYVLSLAKLQRAAGLDAQVLTGSIHNAPQVALDRYEHEGVPVHRIHRDDEFFDHHVKSWHPGISARFGELLDELRRLRTVARDVVWARLGVAAQPGVPFDGK